MTASINPNTQIKQLKEARRVCHNFSKKLFYTLQELAQFQEAHDLLENLNYKKRAEIPIELLSHAKHIICKNMEKHLFNLSPFDYQEHDASINLLAKLRNEKPIQQKFVQYTCRPTFDYSDPQVNPHTPRENVYHQDPVED